MKFNVPSKTLYNCVSAVSKIINARNALTILNNFKLELEGDTLKVTAADGENFLEGRISVTDSSGEGAVCVDARRLVELLKELPDVGISVEVDPERSFEMSINYANGEFKFMGFEGQGFALLFLQSGGYKKDSVRSYDACLIKLVFIYNEIFP